MFGGRDSSFVVTSSKIALANLAQNPDEPDFLLKQINLFYTISGKNYSCDLSTKSWRILLVAR